MRWAPSGDQVQRLKLGHDLLSRQPLNLEAFSELGDGAGVSGRESLRGLIENPRIVATAKNPLVVSYRIELLQ